MVNSPWTCGEHFCENRGDCLACYSGDDCYDGRAHCYANEGDDLAYPLYEWEADPFGKPTRIARA